MERYIKWKNENIFQNGYEGKYCCDFISKLVYPKWEYESI